jgi:hypothetical protein
MSNATDNVITDDLMSILRCRCLDRADMLSDNGICWAPEEDVDGILEGLNFQNLESKAQEIADVANWFN